LRKAARPPPDFFQPLNINTNFFSPFPLFPFRASRTESPFSDRGPSEVGINSRHLHGGAFPACRLIFPWPLFKPNSVPHFHINRFTDFVSGPFLSFTRSDAKRSSKKSFFPFVGAENPDRAKDLDHKVSCRSSPSQPRRIPSLR